jgi:hypothetical protein
MTGEGETNQESPVNAIITYPPLNELKPVAEHIWIVDGPAIPFGLSFFRMKFPTRMTIIRLPEGDLFIHSPTPLGPELQHQVQNIGKPQWIIGPNRIHYSWIPQWREAYPGADIYLAPRIREQARGRIDFPAHQLAGNSGYPWDEVIATLPVAGAYMTEFEFFHRPSRTLILTDLIENFESNKLSSGFSRWLAWLGGALAPDGQMPRDMRFTYPRAELRQAIETMMKWGPERIILAHGRWYQANGAAELRRAFRWLS